MIFKLVWENVKHRPLRTFLSALLIAVPVTLVLTLTGLSKGLIDDSNRRNRGVGADIMIRPKKSSMLALGSAPIPEKVVDVVRREPHVAFATGVVMQTLGSAFSTAVGIDWAEFDRLSGGLEYLQGGQPKNPDEVVVDDFFAQQNKIRAGDSIELLGQKRLDFLPRLNDDFLEELGGLWIAPQPAGIAHHVQGRPRLARLGAKGQEALAGRLGTEEEALQGFDRYVLLAFPLFMGWGGWLAERQKARRATLMISGILLVGFSGLWGLWAWIG